LHEKENTETETSGKKINTSQVLVTQRKNPTETQRRDFVVENPTRFWSCSLMAKKPTSKLSRRMRKLGRSKSAAKIAAARLNGRKGGRPKNPRKGRLRRENRARAKARAK
jgi:hypothetical protein